LLQSLRQLVKLQVVDEEIAGVDLELARLPGERSAVASAIQQAKDSIAAGKELLESEELEERRLEADMREQEARMEHLNAQSGQVASTQAFEALQHEIDAASQAGSEFETRALELMEAIDRARTQLAEAEEAFRRGEKAAPEDLQQIASRGLHFDTERSELLARREKESVGIEVELLTRYERIALKHKPAVVVLVDKSCPRCQMAVPSQRLSEIKRAEAVHACGSCQRLLVSPSALEG
jgi:predicted  nucleic acid-binding Zn-ribbon protein